MLKNNRCHILWVFFLYTSFFIIIKFINILTWKHVYIFVCLFYHRLVITKSCSIFTFPFLNLINITALGTNQKWCVCSCHGAMRLNECWPQLSHRLHTWHSHTIISVHRCRFARYFVLKQISQQPSIMSLGGKTVWAECIFIL